MFCLLFQIDSLQAAGWNIRLCEAFKQRIFFGTTDICRFHVDQCRSEKETVPFHNSVRPCEPRQSNKSEVFGTLEACAAGAFVGSWLQR